MRIALVTCAAYPNLSVSDTLLAEELRARGHEVDALVWNGTQPGPTADVVVIRSSWDYHTAVDDYRAWLHQVATGSRLLNPAPLVEWSLDKGYLLELADRGVPIPPTVLVEPGFVWAADPAKTVVKPRVGASSTGVHLAEPGELDRFRADPDAHRGVMLQELVDDIGGGEWSIVLVGGSYSHAFQQAGGDGTFEAGRGLGGASAQAEAAPELVAFAERVVSQL
ncbi:MAG: hypothetical protein AAGC53_21200, partial [Actinomycetota bacterium]